MSEPRAASSVRRFGQALVRVCVTTAVRQKWLVISAALVLAALGAYAATGLRISTATQDILSAELRFFQIQNRYRAAFPEREPVIVVVDAK
jgi:predicted RND superfamily exporter protein